MGSLRRKTWTKPLPDGAELVVRKGRAVARWTDGRGRTQTAPVTRDADGRPWIELTSRKWLAKYRRGDGIIVEVSTGCTDRSAAEQWLAEREREADRVRAGVVTTAETRTLEHRRSDIRPHFDDYVGARKAQGRCCRPADTLRQLTRVADDCGFGSLGDVTPDAFGRWLARQADAGVSAATRNRYRAAWIGFLNWSVRVGRLLTNPLASIDKADEAADRRLERRALTEAELLKLLDVARRRPVIEAATVRRGRDAGKAIANLRPATVARLELLGRERALMYKTLVLTGLRKNELATLTVGQLNLDADPAFLTLDAADEKNRQGNTLPIRSDLAADLRQWIEDKATAQGGDADRPDVLRFAPVATKRGSVRPSDAEAAAEGLPANSLVFTVPPQLVKILDRDLRAAGIAKRDDRGRTVDVHALRHTFGTHLSKAGVSPRTAQAAMRHSRIDLTMNVYTDPLLLDLSGAVERLPDLPLDDRSDRDSAADG